MSQLQKQKLNPNYNIFMNKLKKISLPCLRGRMGDWYYYVTVLKFSEVALRVKLPKEINNKYKDKSLKLSEWIQREIEENRTNSIVDYLKNQEQRFFNSLILGIYDGKPSWQDIELDHSDIYDNNEEELEYFSKTFGILTLTGDESIFAIDGQHRASSIRKAVEQKPGLKNDEIASIFIAHKTSIEGNIRTRRLFSTLNRYAKPVSQSEIIALSEDNNCAIITRELIDEFILFSNKILITKTRSINRENTNSFTNVMVLYDMVERLLTDKSVLGIKVTGHPKNDFITSRVENKILKKEIAYVKEVFEKMFDTIPELKTFKKEGVIDRQDKKTSLLFRPIGQNIFIDVYKVCSENNKVDECLTFFSNRKFNLVNEVWRKVFWDEETENIITDKSRQRYSSLLILEKLGIAIKRTKKDLAIYDRFNFTASNI